MAFDLRVLWLGFSFGWIDVLSIVGLFREVDFKWSCPRDRLFSPGSIELRDARYV
ncbi:uncharacterized protein BP01DRAFT_360807 [Aspergillus saccharolyticus JOP 1030-1]|uniref:Uncharacterized protein n=1 Tax=Aspergillus saccharolyticus JOP 1030-1 TaxID=1450539 RepID=A0A318ZL25_9EURO|nr:hypothetical protein BP01DRAFT_360807 [Aspergillus saccharolyticus JOP 1030-1]PYH40938.1 hypothetical protein BP01DRAFT_360807 [Aspergillus saccharolyticus JOP 1030-1]